MLDERKTQLTLIAIRDGQKRKGIRDSKMGSLGMRKKSHIERPPGMQINSQIGRGDGGGAGSLVCEDIHK